MVGAGEASLKESSRVVKSVVCDMRLSQDETMQFPSSRCCNFGREERARKETSSAVSYSLLRMSDSKLLVRSPPRGERRGEMMEVR